MKLRTTLILVTVIALCGFLSVHWRSQAGEAGSAVEYVTLRWDGRDNTHLIRPKGEVESLGAKFKGVKKPDRTDERAFYMNLAMNALAQEGYELVALTSDDYVFRRTVTP